MTEGTQELRKGNDPPAAARQKIAGLCFGIWLAIVPVKFGNPIIFERLLGVPRSFYELILGPWPVSWSGGALAVIAAAAALVWKKKGLPPGWVSGALLGWLGWTLLSGLGSVDPRLTRLTLLQFGGCVVCFGAGLFGLSGLRDWRPVWLGLGLGLMIILGTALDQHFGGLEATRRWFEAQPEEVRARLDTPEFRKKILSNRVFGTFIYPNALAGGLLLLLPVTLAGLRQPARNAVVVGVLRGLLAAAGVGVLYWSGSKSGWLIALVMAGLAFWRLPAKAPFRLAILIGLTGLGIGAFFGKHRDYFEKGASSLAARLDYWRAAGRMIQERPFIGFGPGTYQRQYARLKPPEAEMAKLTHNDYLQQGADSGLPALIAYTGFIFGSVLWLYRRSRRSAVHFAVWLGVSAFAVQSLTEFGLYIPGLAWSFFLFLGWLWGTQPNEFDTLEAASYDCRQKT